MTFKAIGFPSRYVQGPGALKALGPLVEEFGGRVAAVLAGDSARAASGDAVKASLEGAGRSVQFLRFQGECSAEGIAEYSRQAAASKADTVIALGGGKVIDTGKGVARTLNALLIVVPTIASTDAPTSRSIVMHDDSGRVTGVVRMRRNPDAVVVDTDVVARAPLKFFAAGIGDALSKKFEVAQCCRLGAKNFYGTLPPPVAMLFAERCYDTIAEYGETACKRIAAAGKPDEAVERVVEATVLFSGLGFEGGGLSMAHALSRGLGAHPQIGSALHGEVIAFGTIAQLLAEERPAEEVRAHVALTRRLGLPVTLAQLGAPSIDAAALMEIGRLACEAPYIANISPRVDQSRVAEMLRAADALGRSALQSGS
ncbi:MAG: glycerol dehydrogenase [Betaproteobacteria bacterium]|nr:glycerol dehydrogenase [Betaproteobacteria bacterium]